MSVNRNSVHSVTARCQDVACETSLRYYLKKLNMEEQLKSNEKIPLQEVVKTLKTGRTMKNDSREMFVFGGHLRNVSYIVMFLNSSLRLIKVTSKQTTN